MGDGFLQLVARWLVAQTVFLCCFCGGGGGGGDVCDVSFALVLPHLHQFSFNFFSLSVPHLSFQWVACQTLSSVF